VFKLSILTLIVLDGVDVSGMAVVSGAGRGDDGVFPALFHGEFPG